MKNILQEKVLKILKIFVYIYGNHVTWKFEEGVKIDIRNGIVICAQHKNNEIAL